MEVIKEVFIYYLMIIVAKIQIMYLAHKLTDYNPILFIGMSNELLNPVVCYRYLSSDKSLDVLASSLVNSSYTLINPVYNFKEYHTKLNITKIALVYLLNARLEVLVAISNVSRDANYAHIRKDLISSILFVLNNFDKSELKCLHERLYSESL